MARICFWVAAGALVLLHCACLAAASPAAGSGFSARFAAEKDFSSTLPLVIVETGTDGVVSGEARAVIRIIDNADGVNRLSDSPAVHSQAFLRRLDDGLADDKAVFAVSLRTDTDEARTLSLLGMPESVEWTLNGSPADRMMLRNYIGHTLARAIIPGATPEVRYCEVFFGDGIRHYYQGLYLFEEKIVAGAWLSDRATTGIRYYAAGDSSGAQPEDAQPFDPTLPFTRGGVRLSYPDPAPPERLDAARDELTAMEHTVSSDSAATFFSYIGSLDVPSFVGCYLLNGVMANDSPGMHAYFFRNAERIGMLPMWDFSHALDNAVRPGAHSGPEEYLPWYRCLARSAGFMDELRSRYYALARGELRPARIDDLVDGIAGRLGPAMERDWNRWRHLYAEDARFLLEPAIGPDGSALSRRTGDVEQEIRKIKHGLRRQGMAMRLRLLEGKWGKYQFDYEMDARRNFLMAAGFVVVFFFVARYARRRV